MAAHDFHRFSNWRGHMKVCPGLSHRRPDPCRRGQDCSNTSELYQIGHHGTKTMQKILVDQFGVTSEPKLWISTIRSVVCLESHDDFMIWSFPGISSHHKCWHQGPKGSSQNCQLSFVLLVSGLCGLLFSCRFKFACHAYSAEIHETSQDYFEQKQVAWCIALRNLTNMRSAIEVAPQAITPQSPTPRSGIWKTL